MAANLSWPIEGAHEGRGLGDTFLGHIERCSVLLHLVDGTAEDVAADYNVIIGELNEYGAGLNEKPRITVLNKSDALSDEDTAEKLAELKAAGAKDVRVMSGVSRDGVVDVLRQMRKVIEAGQVVVEDEGPWTP